MNWTHDNRTGAILDPTMYITEKFRYSFYGFTAYSQGSRSWNPIKVNFFTNIAWSLAYGQSDNLEIYFVDQLRDQKFPLEQVLDLLASREAVPIYITDKPFQYQFAEQRRILHIVD